LHGIEENDIVRSLDPMTTIFWAASLGIGLSLLVFVTRTIRRRRENSRTRSLNFLGAVSQQWLIGHRAEK
jgi:hypothetical protein